MVRTKLNFPRKYLLKNLPINEVQEWITKEGYNAEIREKFSLTNGKALLALNVEDLISMKIPELAVVPLSKLIQSLKQTPQGLKRVRETTYDLPPQDPCDGTKPVVKISSLFASGLETIPELFLYVRDEVKDVWKALETNTSSVLIQGPPGSGKSSICWCWACYISTIQQKNVLWIHFSRFDVNIVLLNQNKAQYRKGSREEVISEINTFTGDVIILDGITEDHRLNLFPYAYRWRFDYKTRQLVLVTSVQLKYGMEDLQMTSTTMVDHPSWTLKQMKEACKNEELYQQIVTKLDVGIDKDEAIERKFSLARGSVRWMFGKNVAEVKVEINNWISTLHVK